MLRLTGTRESDEDSAEQAGRNREENDFADVPFDFLCLISMARPKIASLTEASCRLAACGPGCSLLHSCAGAARDAAIGCGPEAMSLVQRSS